jgi:hypothetical protein
MEEVNLSLCRGFPSTLAIFERHLGDQQLKGRLGSLIQTGTLVISAEEKSKNSGIGLRSKGLPYTRYGPPPRTAILSSTLLNL